jgi:LPXTG-motif cell wall-anchored protein
MPKRGLTSIAVALLLAFVPATALADGGAGDNQYQDPLTAPAPKKPKKKAATTPAPAPSPPATTTAPATSTAPAAATTVASSPSSASSPSGELPRTGAPTDLVGLGGATLVLAGLLLRRRTAPQ